ncbi:uncharacterized protein [Palaemon carinicauda]|uniref:uncharacterized protein n=1 Tax=Palaemon carinicauda TaxID=392227 RepID=UPI0035B5C56F
MPERLDIQHEMMASSQPLSSEGGASLARDVHSPQRTRIPKVSHSNQYDRMKGNFHNSDLDVSAIDPDEISVTSVPEYDAFNRNGDVLFGHRNLGERSLDRLFPGLLTSERSKTKHMSENHARSNRDFIGSTKHVSQTDITGTMPTLVLSEDNAENSETFGLVANSTSPPISENFGTVEQLVQEQTPITDASMSFAEEIVEDTTPSSIPTTVEYEEYIPSDVQLRHNAHDTVVQYSELIVEIPVTTTTTDMPSTNEIASTSTGFVNELASTTDEPQEDITGITWPVTEDSPETFVAFTGENFESVEIGRKEKNEDATTLVTEEYLYSTVPISEETTSFLLPVTDDRDSKFNLKNHNPVASLILKTAGDDLLDMEETDERILPEVGNSKNFETVTVGFDENHTEITEDNNSVTEKAMDISEDRIFNDHTEESNVEDSTFEMSDIETTEVVLLEASMGVNHVTTESPLEPTSFDVKIKTIKDLQVDAIFDPSQVAKATSYEESSYSTATRSATVTTWVDPNSKNLVNQGSANLTDLREVINSGQNPKGDQENIRLLTDYLNGGHGMESIDNSFPITHVPFVDDKSSYSTTYYEATASNKDAGSKEEKLSTIELSSTENSDKLSTSRLNPESYESDTPRIPVLKFNIGEFETVNGTRVYLTDNGKTATQFIYEMPNMNRSSGTHLTPSVVIALSICCSLIVLISILTVSLWFCRRHKNRSKIYLSRDAARPRAFFTKPMNPALLPEETPDLADPMYLMEFQKPRPPIVLSDDPDCIIIDGQTVLKSETEGYEGGIENKGFVDIPLEEIKSANYTNICSTNDTCGHVPPKIGLKGDHECDSDSGIRVWSSTGSLYAVARDLSHCSLPPPPYSSSIGEESINLAVDTFSSLGSKPGLLYV